MEPASHPQPTDVNSVMNENPPHVISSISSDPQSNPRQIHLNRADPDIRAGKILSNLPGCPKRIFLDINWHPPSRSGAFRLRTKVFFADGTLEQAEQAIFLFIFPDKVQHLSLHPNSDPVQGGHTHVLHFDFKTPATFVSPSKNLDSADPDSSKTIEFFSNLVNFPTLDLPLDLASVSTLPGTAAALTTKTNLAMLEDMCKAFEEGNGMPSILSCLSASTLYNGKGGVPTTPAQFPDVNPPDYASSRKRPASHPTASPSSPQLHAEQHQLGLDLFEELSWRVDTVVQQMDSYRTSMDARLQSMIEAHSDIQSRRHRSLTDEIDAQRARFDVLLARSGTYQARSDAHFQAMMEQIESQRASLDTRLQAVRNAPSDSQPRRLDTLTWQLDIQRERSDTRLRSLTDQLASTRAHAEAQAMHLHALNEELRSDLSRRIDSLTGQIHTQNADQTRITDSLAGRVETLTTNQARRIEDLAEQLQTQNDDQTRLIDALLDRVETLTSNQARRIEDLAAKLQTQNNDQTRHIDLLAKRVETFASDQRRLVEDLIERVGYLEEDIRSASDLARHNQRRLNGVEAERGSLFNSIGRCENKIGEKNSKEGVHRIERAFEDEI
ncbi:hypothetical protein CCMA1212_004518 [Trichoderma ghanense]|uniref:Uncharacterized protein n=1 Tax=Trichoderma ghanense TaxID=65468 RepID=A0ABY2H5P6_9HYPO